MPVLSCRRIETCYKKSENGKSRGPHRSNSGSLTFDRITYIIRIKNFLKRLKIIYNNKS